MAAADTARLIASLELQTQKFDAGFGKVSSGMDRLDKRFAKSAGFWKHSISTAFGVGLERAVSAGVRGVFGALNAGIASLQEQGKVVAQTNAVIKSTGNTAHVTAAEIRSLSEATETKTAIDDKQIQTAANLLLTFTNIRNEAGKGNDIYTQSVGVLADLATAMGTDASGGAIQLGKALNDPLKGMTALKKIGVTFSAEQTAQIKGFVGQGDALKNLKEAGIQLTKQQKEQIKALGPVVDTVAAAQEAHVKLTAAEIKQFNAMSDGTGIIQAQKIILAELNKEFGGSGAAFAETDAGKAAKFADAIEDIQKAFASGLLPAITRVRETLTKFLTDPATMGQIEQVGNAIAGIFSEGNIKTAASAMTTAASAIGVAIKLFSGLPKEVQALAIGALALKKITGIGPLDIVKGAGGLIKMVFERGATPANPLFVSDIAGAAGGLAGGAAKTGLGALSKVFLVGEAIGLALLVNEVRNGIADGNTKVSEGLVKQTHEWLAQQPSKADLKNGLGAVDKGINELQMSNLPLTLVQGQALDNLKIIRQLILDQLAIDMSPEARQARNDLLKRLQSTDDRGRDTKAALAGMSVALTAMQTQLHADLLAAIGVLKTSKDSTAIAAAVAKALAAVKGGAGSTGTTKGLLDDLKTQLAAAQKAGNGPLADKIKNAIKQIEPFAKGRQWQQEQIAAARKIAESNRTTADKVAALKSIEADLLSHQRTMAGQIVGGLLDVVNAIHNIKLSGAIANGQGGGALPRDNRPRPTPLPAGTPEIRNGFVIKATINNSIKDTVAATVLRGRIGPTPAEAGSA